MVSGKPDMEKIFISIRMLKNLGNEFSDETFFCKKVVT